MSNSSSTPLIKSRLCLIENIDPGDLLTIRETVCWSLQTYLCIRFGAGLHNVIPTNVFGGKGGYFNCHSFKVQ